MSYEMSTQGPLNNSDASAIVDSYLTSAGRQTLAATGADRLPSRLMIDASTAAYFKYLYHRIPVLDSEDVFASHPSTLLLQTVCFVGAFLRHPKSLDALQETEAFYTKAKFLFFINHEHQPVAILKALCFFTLWNVKPPSVVTIDCSWNWLGLAIRLALQMGLHQESTHSKSTTPACCRRIAWYLYAQDKIISVCFGRPQMLRAQDFDLRPLLEADFEESQRDQGRLFILYTQLATICAKMIDLQSSDLTNTFDRVLSVLLDLKSWVLHIPADFRLSDDNGNALYHREFYELLVCYLTCIITYFHMYGRYFQPAVVSRISLVASSCIIALYQQMDYRDDINYLTAINNWSMMAASLAQLKNLSPQNLGANMVENPSGQSASSLEELETVVQILRQRTSKFPGANALIHRVERLKEEIFSQCNNLSSPSALGSGAASRNLANPTQTTYATVSNMHELFPFPKSLTPRLELLDALETEILMDGYIDPYPEWTMDTILGFDDVAVNFFA